MKKFALKFPFVFSLVIFLIIFIVGSCAGIVFGLLMMEGCKPATLNDPCDGEAMAIAFIWYLSFIASLLLGIVAGVSSFLFLKVTNRKK